MLFRETTAPTLNGHCTNLVRYSGHPGMFLKKKLWKRTYTFFTLNGVIFVQPYHICSQK